MGKEVVSTGTDEQGLDEVLELNKRPLDIAESGIVKIARRKYKVFYPKKLGQRPEVEHLVPGDVLTNYSFESSYTYLFLDYNITDLPGLRKVIFAEPCLAIGPKGVALLPRGGVVNIIEEKDGVSHYRLVDGNSEDLRSVSLGALRVNGGLELKHGVRIYFEQIYDSQMEEYHNKNLCYRVIATGENTGLRLDEGKITQGVIVEELTEADRTNINKNRIYYELVPLIGPRMTND